MNGLWFLSLVISITCALLATLLQQWARRYLKATQPRYSLHKRARMRSFFAEGFEKSLLPLAVEALPALLHLSLFLFFAGLGVFLCNVDLTIFKLVLSWIGVCTALYGCITLIPIFRQDSPYYTPLTPLARPIAVATLIILLVTQQVFLFLCFYFRLLFRISYYCCSCRWDACHALSSFAFGPRIFRSFRTICPDDRLKQVLIMTSMTPEEAAMKVSSSIDTRAFMWTLDSLDEDYELERFFSSLPDFRRSKVVDDPLPNLTPEEKVKISQTLLRFLDFTFSSDLLPEAIKHQRAIMCAKALDLAQFSPESVYRLCDTIFYHRTRQTTNVGPIADNSATEHNAFVQAVVTRIIARLQQHDDSWFRQFAPNALGVPETVLRDYAANGDSLSLAILIYVTRQQFTYFQYSSWPTYEIWDILDEGSKFNAQNTSPKLQHEFCTLWNQIVLKAQNDDDRTIVKQVLIPILTIYGTLHHDTDSAPTRFTSLPSSYPLCKVAGHVHVNSAPTPSACAIPHDLTAVPPSLASLDPASSPIPVPLHVTESPTDVLSLDNFHPPQATIQDLHIPLTSVDQATASVIQDIDTSGTTMLPPAPETSTSAPLSSSLPSAIPLQHNADQLTPSGLPNYPSSASLNPVLDTMLPTGPSLSSHSPITPPSLSPAFPESHQSIIVSTPPGASPGMTNAPDPGAPPSTAPVLREEKDTFDRPSVNRANTTVAPDLPLQVPLPLSTIDSDIAIAGPSSRELNVECTSDHSPAPSDFQYDIV